MILPSYYQLDAIEIFTTVTETDGLWFAIGATGILIFMVYALTRVRNKSTQETLILNITKAFTEQLDKREDKALSRQEKLNDEIEKLRVEVHATQNKQVDIVEKMADERVKNATLEGRIKALEQTILYATNERDKVQAELQRVLEERKKDDTLTRALDQIATGFKALTKQVQETNEKIKPFLELKPLNKENNT